MHRLRQLFFVADPISSEAREMLEKNYENGYLIGEVLLSSKKKHEEVTLKDGAKVYMDIA